MNDENLIVNFEDAIKLLNTASELFTVDIWIPSIKKTLKFKEMEAKQQKKLLGVAIENNLYNYQFSSSFYEILKQNIIETEEIKSDVIDSLDIFDKTAIALSLRKQISNTLKVYFDEQKKISKSVDLDSILEKFKNIEYSSEKKVLVENENVSIIVNLKIPTIKEDVDYDLNISKIFKNADEIKNENDLKQIITEAFITESSKYIDKIYISSQEIDFKKLTLKQVIQITEKLPSTIMQKILETISEWKSAFDSILTIEHESKTTTIKIDSILFLN